MNFHKTHLYEWHKKRARMIEFVGWHMPLWYEETGGIIKEHLAVRNNVGIFDVTHMGRLLINGNEAESFLQYVTTNNVRRLKKLGQGQYSVVCNENGGIKDDITIFKIEDNKYVVITNAVNREKIYNWFKTHAQKFDVKIEDISNITCMFAVQGPKAQSTLEKLTDNDLSEIKRYSCALMKLGGYNVIISRSGYTGEDGFEIIMLQVPYSEKEKATDLWEKILEAGKEYEIKPCGLGARDTLRLEAGMVLYGNDIDETISPLEAKLNFVVKFKKGDFIGRDALLKQKEEGVKRIRVGLELFERRVPRHGYEIKKDGENIGVVTSGAFSPILEKGIGLGLVSSEHAQINEIVQINIKGKLIDAKLVKWPFYDTNKYGYTRKKAYTRGDEDESKRL